MRRDERAKRQKLDATLERLDAAEARALADLTAAGYKFATVAAARRYKAQLAAFDRFQHDYDHAALEAAFQPQRRRAS